MSFKDIKTGSGEEKSYEPVPAGLHLARCYSIIDLGTQVIEWQGEKKNLRKIHITWELPDLMREFTKKEKQPQVVGKEYTLSFGDKANLYNDLLSWFSDEKPDGDMQSWLDNDVVGRAAMLNVTHKVSAKGNTYAKIASITPLPEGTDCPKQINPSLVFDLEGEFDRKKFDRIPPFLQEKIVLAPEFPGIAVEKEDTSFKAKAPDARDDYVEDDPLPF